MPRFYAVLAPVYQPAMRLITVITNANPASVTTSFDHSYVTGTVVRILVPFEFGMQQIHNEIGTITVTGATTFTIDINTTAYDSFAIPAPIPDEVGLPAQVIPIGEIAEILTAAVRNVLPY